MVTAPGMDLEAVMEMAMEAEMEEEVVVAEEEGEEMEELEGWVVLEALDLLDLMVTAPGMDLEDVMEKMADREERMEENRRTKIKIVEPDSMFWFKKYLILKILVIQ